MTVRWLAGAVAATCLAAAIALSPAQGGERASRFTAKGELLFPDDYRSWVFLSSGHGMSYNAAANAVSSAPFQNVFADPRAHAAFLKTGHWPLGTVLVLEIRGSSEKGSINCTVRSSRARRSRSRCMSATIVHRRLGLFQV